MLADSVEAAAKAMKDPSVKKMQGLIREIFKQKVDDGQLEKSSLTFGDLEKIREVFESGLRGLAGHRIEYPRENGRPERHLPAAVGGELAAAGAGRRVQARLQPVAAKPAGLPQPMEPEQK
jgi:hypothetical protein